MAVHLGWKARGCSGGVVLLLLCFAALAWTFVASPLTVDEDEAVLPPLPDQRVSVEVLGTGDIESSLGFSVRGGSLGAAYTSAMAAFGVDHPEGYLLVDAGVGVDGQAHFATTPWLMQAVASLHLEHGLAEVLAQRGRSADQVEGVLLTHAHWDHVSGLADLPGVPVWMLKEEEDFAASSDHGLLYRQLNEATPIPVRTLTFDAVPYGPFARHRDLFDDGTVIVVPMPGHTPGSIGVFVHTRRQRLLFVGDTSWTREGVDWPAEKPWITKTMVDADPAGVRAQLVLLHRLQRSNPGLLIVPAHDGRVHDEVIEGPRLDRGTKVP